LSETGATKPPFGLENVSQQLDFLQYADKEAIKKIARGQREDLFGAAPQIALPEIPQGVWERWEFEQGLKKK